MAIIDVVKWNASDNIYAWKFPSEELSTWTQLIVSESQEAMLLKNGKMVGPFLPGRYTLSTENFPILTKILKMPFGGRTPFSAEIWFVNKTIPLDVKWGTPDAIQVLDPLYKVMLPIRANGQYGVQIEDTRMFLTKLVGTGTTPSFDRERLVSYFRGAIVTRAKDLIAKIILDQNISILQINSRLNEISDAMMQQLAEDFGEFGLKTKSFFVNSISTQDDDPTVQKLKAALAKRAEMNIIGFSYQQERSFDSLQSAAQNDGGGNSNSMGAMIGLGVGAAVGGAFGQVMTGISQNIQATPIICPKCNHQNEHTSKFCVQCGNSLIVERSQGIMCAKCGIKSIVASKFCANCGNTLTDCCTKCGKTLQVGAKFCASCGHQQQ